MSDEELYLLEVLRSMTAGTARLASMAAADGVLMTREELRGNLRRLEVQGLVRSRGARWEAVE